MSKKIAAILLLCVLVISCKPKPRPVSDAQLDVNDSKLTSDPNQSKSKPASGQVIFIRFDDGEMTRSEQVIKDDKH